MFDCPDRELEPPNSQEKCFVFEGTSHATVRGYVWARDAGEAREKIERGEYDDIDDYDFEDIHVDTIEEDD